MSGRQCPCGRETERAGNRPEWVGRASISSDRDCPTNHNGTSLDRAHPPWLHMCLPPDVEEDSKTLISGHAKHTDAAEETRRRLLPMPPEFPIKRHRDFRLGMRAAATGDGAPGPGGANFRRMSQASYPPCAGACHSPARRRLAPCRPAAW